MVFISAVVTSWSLSIAFCGSPPVPWRCSPDPPLQGGGSPLYRTFKQGWRPLSLLWAPWASRSESSPALSAALLTGHMDHLFNTQFYGSSLPILPIPFRDYSVVLHEQKYQRNNPALPHLLSFLCWWELLLLPTICCVDPNHHIRT